MPSEFQAKEASAPVPSLTDLLKDAMQQDDFMQETEDYNNMMQQQSQMSTHTSNNNVYTEFQAAPQEQVGFSTYVPQHSVSETKQTLIICECCL